MILEFCNSEKVMGVPNKIFPLVIITIITNFYVFMVLIDDNNSCKKIRLKNEKIFPYEVSYLQAFNNAMTHP